MSIRRSIAAAVFVAAVSAPTVLGATQAMADTAPSGPGRSQPDAPAPDTEPSGAPAGPSADEAAARARLEQLLTEPGHYAFYYEKVQEALAGPPAGWQIFLDTGLQGAILTDKRIRTTQIMSVSERHSALWQAAQDTLDDLSGASLDHFLTVTWPAAASTNRVRVSQLLEDPSIGRKVREAAEKAIDGTDLEVALFLQQLPALRLADDRIRVAQLIGAGGPEVREAGRAVLENGSAEAVREFLERGWSAAKAKDDAAQLPAPGATTTPVTTTPVTTTTTTAVTAAATTTQATAPELAATGADAPLGALTAGGAAAIALGAATVLVTRRRQQQS
ncbi:ALF repeat-containing protein [Streptomyces sp. TLI_171]|uniref:ALF repeat-containing protein n=1 Tax=Streptomyces sp. TLI_171 TaxID=1938859 RepID=UPI00118090BA|nr:ALF repeat-containing protein [Streptomyces sp. TLI_171]